MFASLLALALAAAPSAVDRARLDRIDSVVKQAIDHGDLPGAVVLVLHRGEVVFHRAYGLRSKQPAETPMKPDTPFDLASLTKPIATATSLLILVERGKLRISDPVAQYLPEFGQNGKEKVTVEQLLTHTGGLVADNNLADYQNGKEKALERVWQLKPSYEPGTRFVYSDVGFIVLGQLVERVSGQSLDKFAQENIFTPLGMRSTGFLPPAALAEKAAPTEKRDGHWMVGEVHDPRAYLLGGVAGHAGLFSTAEDLAIYARMILGGGSYQGKRVLSPETVRLMTTPHPVPGGLRALGWDVQTSYSSNRGELFPAGRTFGHTGFTGTSIWIDPETETAVIFLSNRVHPEAKTNINKVRGQVATLAAAALVGERLKPNDPPRPGKEAHDTALHPVKTGIDVLEAEQFARLKRRRVALVTNHTGVNRDGHSTIDLLAGAPGVKLVALFSPEHGIRGQADEKVGDTHDEKTGLPVYSLYGDRRKPTAETLRGVDTLVYDIQDAGCRFYTYITTLGLVLEAAAEHKVKVLVLDRPNPIGGVAVDGPVLDAGRESFVAYHRLPIRHGLTVGELARLYNAERKLGADLEVVAMEGWRRGDFYDRTGLPWIDPSPNLRGLTAAYLYPGIGLLETTNVSVGRGTERPFEWVGAPWIDGRRLALALGEQGLPGVRFVPRRFTPTYSVHKGQACDGVQLIVDDWQHFEPLRTGLVLAEQLHRLYPDTWQIDRFDRLLGHRVTLEAVRRGASWEELQKGWQPELDGFRERRKVFLLYQE